MQKNVANQKFVVFAFDRTDNTPKTGDAANITAKIKIDSAAAGAITDTNPTEIEDGYYEFDLTQAESNGDRLLILPESSTADIQVIGCPSVIYTNPENYAELGIESDGDLTKVNTLDGHTAQTGDGYAIVNDGTYGNSAIEALVDELETRLTALRAGYLDNLNIGENVAGTSEISGLNDPSALAIADTVWDEAKAGHVAAGSFGEEIQSHSLSSEVAALNDVSTAQVQSSCDAAITANTDINNIDTGVNNIEAKLPTNYIMGSSDQTDKDDEIDTMKVILDKLDTALVLDGAVYQYTTNALENGPGGAGGGLPGSNLVTITVQDGDGANIVECAVEIWDEAGTTFYERKTTNASGQTTYNRDDGTYTVKMHKAGYTFDDETLVVDGTENVTYIGTESVPTDPTDTEIIRVYEYCYDPDHTPVSGVVATATIKSLPYDYDGKVYSGQVYNGVYDYNTGIVYWDIVKGASTRFVLTYFGIDTIKTVPLTGTTLRLSDMA